MVNQGHRQRHSAPAVMVTPASVVAHGLNQVVFLNMAEGWLAFAGSAVAPGW